MLALKKMYRWFGWWIQLVDATHYDPPVRRECCRWVDEPGSTTPRAKEHSCGSHGRPAGRFTRSGISSIDHTPLSITSCRGPVGFDHQSDAARVPRSP